MLNCICHSFLFLLWTIFFSCVCSFLPLLLLPLLLFPKFLPRPVPFLFPFPLLLFSAVTNSTVELFRLWLLNSCSYDCPISPSKPHLSECGNHLNAPGPRSPPGGSLGPPPRRDPRSRWVSVTSGPAAGVPLPPLPHAPCPSRCPRSRRGCPGRGRVPTSVHSVLLLRPDRS